MAERGDVERAILGSMMLSGDAIRETLGVIEIAMFEHPSHRKILASIYRCAYGDGCTIQNLLEGERKISEFDTIAVAEDLEKRGELESVGGPAYIARILETVPHAAHAKYYAEILIDRSQESETENVSSLP